MFKNLTKFKKTQFLWSVSFLGILGLVLSLDCSANEGFRPTSGAELKSYSHVTEETASYVPGSQVAWANYELIFRDFPALHDELGLSTQSSPHFSDEDRRKINDWLLSTFSFVGAKQHQLNKIRHSEIPTDNTRTTQAYRPKEWIRSAVLEAKGTKSGATLGMVDVKGFGHGGRTGEETLSKQVRKYEDALKAENSETSQAKLGKLRTKGHSDGLMSFGEAGAEVTRQRAIQSLFERTMLPLETVESYAIIKLPFQIYKDNGKSMPAALCLRQAHFDRAYDVHSSPDKIFIDPHGKKQTSASGTVVDFGGAILSDPVLKSHFGHDESKIATVDGKKVPDAQYSHPWAWAHQAAESEHPDAMRNHIREMDEAINRAYPSSSELVERRKRVLALQQDAARRIRTPDPNNQQPLSVRLPNFQQQVLTHPENTTATHHLLSLHLQEEDPLIGQRARLFREYFDQDPTQNPESLVALAQSLWNINHKNKSESDSLLDPSSRPSVYRMAGKLLARHNFNSFQGQVFEAIKTAGTAEQAHSILSGLIGASHPETVDTYLSGLAEIKSRFPAAKVSILLLTALPELGRQNALGVNAFGRALDLTRLNQMAKYRNDFEECSVVGKILGSFAQNAGSMQSMRDATPDQLVGHAARILHFATVCDYAWRSLPKGDPIAVYSSHMLDALFEKLGGASIDASPSVSKDLKGALALGWVLGHPKSKAMLLELAKVKPWKEVESIAKAAIAILDTKVEKEILLSLASESGDENCVRGLYLYPGLACEVLLAQLRGGRFRPTTGMLFNLEQAVEYGGLEPAKQRELIQALSSENSPEFLSAIAHRVEKRNQNGTLWSELASAKLTQLRESSEPHAIDFILSSLKHSSTRGIAKEILIQRTDQTSYGAMAKREDRPYERDGIDPEVTEILTEKLRAQPHLFKDLDPSAIRALIGRKHSTPDFEAALRDQLVHQGLIDPRHPHFEAIHGAVLDLVKKGPASGSPSSSAPERAYKMALTMVDRLPSEDVSRGQLVKELLYSKHDLAPLKSLLLAGQGHPSRNEYQVILDALAREMGDTKKNYAYSDLDRYPVSALARVVAMHWIQKGFIQRGTSDYETLVSELLDHYKVTHAGSYSGGFLDTFLVEELAEVPSAKLVTTVCRTIGQDKGMSNISYGKYPASELAIRIAKKWEEKLEQRGEQSGRLMEILDALSSTGSIFDENPYRTKLQSLKSAEQNAKNPRSVALSVSPSEVARDMAALEGTKEHCGGNGN